MLLLLRLILFFVIFSAVAKFIHLAILFCVKKKQKECSVLAESEKMLKCCKCGFYVSRKSLYYDNVKKTYSCVVNCVPM